MKKIFNWANIRLALMFALVIFLFSFTAKRNGQRKLVRSVVVFTDDKTPFLTQESVNKLLIENKKDASAFQKVEVDLDRLEHAINRNPMVEKSEVSVSIDGVLKAIVKQKTPIARFFDQDKSFYIDYQGSVMPLSNEFTARVPLVSGEINNKNQADLNKLLRFVYDDEFLRKNIIGIQVLANGNVKMMNRNFDYEIDFGRTINMERKFSNYKAFFQKAVSDSSLYRYKKINLKFTQQVVCTK